MRLTNRTRTSAALGALLALGALGALGGCHNFLDVNQNPNAPETAKVDIRLPALEAMFIHSTYYGENSLWGAEWTQQFAFRGDNRSYAQVHRYEIAETDASTLWDYAYTRPSMTRSKIRGLELAAGAPPRKGVRGIAGNKNAKTREAERELDRAVLKGVLDRRAGHHVPSSATR